MKTIVQDTLSVFCKSYDKKKPLLYRLLPTGTAMAFFFMLKSFAWQLDSYQAAALTQIGEMNHTIVGKNNLLYNR